MMPKMSAQPGYAKRICLLIVCLISFSRLAAQEQSARFLWSLSDAEGFIAHISSPAPISSASLVTSAETIELSVSPIESEVWFLLDASSSMVNSAPALQAALQDYPFEEVGFINFAASLEVLSPTTDNEAISDWLSAYHAISNEGACFADALNALAEQAYNREKGRQIIAIVGEYQACESVPSLNYPVQIIVIAADAAPYADFGEVQRASLQTLRSTINSLNPVPIYALEGENPSIGDGEIHLFFEDGSSQSIATNYELFIAATAIPSETPTELPTATTAPSETATESPIATDAPPTTAPTIAVTATETPEEIIAPLPVSNDYLILGGGVAAVLVVIVVMVLLLREARRTKPSEDQIDNTLLFQYNDEAELDQTNIVSIREMMAKVRPTLAARLTDEAGNVYEIHRPITTLGRREDSDIRIENDKQISREHLRFTVREDGSIWITRLSQNPVLLNEIAIETMLQIREGDVLQLSPSLSLKLEMVADE